MEPIFDPKGVDPPGWASIGAMPLTISEQLTAIARLDALDRAVWKAEQELEHTPTQLAEERGAVKMTVAERDRLAAALAAAQAGVRDGERDLAALNRRRTRAQDRVPLLTSQSQIEATQREIAAIGEEADEVELATLEGMEQVDDLRGQHATAAAQVTLLEGALERRSAAWASRELTLRPKIAALSAEREPLVAPLGSELMRVYRGGVRASSMGKREPAGATGVTGVTCDTCWAEVPARWVNETIARKVVHACQVCKRILLVDAATPSPE